MAARRGRTPSLRSRWASTPGGAGGRPGTHGPGSTCCAAERPTPPGGDNGDRINLTLPTGTGATIALYGATLFFLTRSPEPHIFRQDVFLIVVLGWLGVATVGSLPFVFSGLMGPVDAFFESMAGFTTTGASTIRVPEEVAPSLLLWRSLTQWAGGIGIVVLFVAVAPLPGVGAARLLGAEMSGLTQPRLTPRMADTAKALVMIYLAISLAEILSLLLVGMSLYDAVVHTFTTAATGGFSPKPSPSASTTPSP
jgi:trk system potassium uptake protein TrkH